MVSLGKPRSSAGGNCSKCGARFGPFEVRRHCRRCGRICCKACLSSEFTNVPGSCNKKPVCNMCLGSNSASFIYLAPPSSDFDLSCNERVLDKSPCDMTCQGCHNYLVGDFVLLDDGKTGYCQSCFVCFADGKVLDGSFIEHEGQIYCEENCARVSCFFFLKPPVVRRGGVGVPAGFSHVLREMIVEAGSCMV